MPGAIDITGKKFGRLTAIKIAYRNNKKRHWLCNCDCGGTATPSISNLMGGHSTSCGCRQSEALTERRDNRLRHGYSRKNALHPTYQTWRSMWQRCGNPKHTAFHRYGGRGIKVCEKWETFDVFIADMGERPDGLTLDRINNNLGYYKENCRWATKVEQAKNRGRRDGNKIT